MSDKEAEKQKRKDLMSESTSEAREKSIDESKPIRSINPLGMRVLVRIKKTDNVSDGGLYLPEGAKEQGQESLLGEVVEVASAHENDDDDVGTNVSGIPLGATVLIPRHAGTRVPWDDRLRIVETKEVLAMVEEVNLT